MSDYPPLPESIAAPAGPVTVMAGLNLKNDDGEAADGLFDHTRRIITIDGTLPARWRWHTYFHEWAHVALMDSGVANLYDDRAIEALCDCFASARMRERFG